MSDRDQQEGPDGPAPTQWRQSAPVKGRRGRATRTRLRYTMFFPTDAGDRLLANLRNGTPSLCAYVFSHPNLVEVAGLAGIDCFMADMMFTALDWADIAALIRAARGTGISPMIRVQAYPWSDGIDQRTVSDAARAQ